MGAEGHGGVTLYEELAQATAVGDVKKVTVLVDGALESGKEPTEIVEKGLAAGMEIIGEKYDKGDAFLVDVIVAANAFKIAMDMIRPHFKATDKKVGTAVMGTVEGDIHDLGKNLVCVALEVSGFNVVDLGNDVTPTSFSSSIKSSNANVLGMSTLITTTMVNMKNTVDLLKEDGVREDVKVIGGGAPIDEPYIREIGGDLYAPNAFEAVSVIKKALGV
jgi:5-methyltetrahydrofolate--homocysteine methyltransferase